MTSTNSSSGNDLSALDVLSALGVVARARKGLLKIPLRVSVVVVDEDTYVFDPALAEPVSVGFDRRAQVAILTNRATLSDALRGRFDPTHPNPQHLFTVRGEDRALLALRQLFERGRSAFEAQLHALKGGS